MGNYYGYGLDPALVGRTLKSVTVEDDGHMLRVVTTDGEQTYDTEGDCCSHTWIEHATIPADVEGATILGLREDFGCVGDDEPDTDWGEVIQVYQSIIATSVGDVVVEYRNSSNGYYGGSLVRSRSTLADA